MNEKIIYKVYIKVDERKSIVDVDSTAFYTEEEFLNDGFVYLDEGDNGEIYGYAKNNYFPSKFDEKFMSIDYIPNFKYVNNKILSLTDEEKQFYKDRNKVKPLILEQDKINADIYLQLAQLQAQTGTPVTLALISPRYEQIKKYYNLELYTEEHLDLFVQVGWISEEEKQQIIQGI